MGTMMRAFAILFTLAALSACGGSGNSGTSPAATAYSDTTSNTAASGNYTVGGTASGLSGNGLILQINGGSDLPIQANGTFTFPGSLASGTSYSVTVAYQPAVSHEICIVANGSGTGDANVANVSVVCTVAVGFVYITDPGNQIGIYGITPGTGAPIPAGSAEVASGTFGLLAAPNGNFLYVLNHQTDQISTFAIDQNQGALTEANSVATDREPCCTVMSPNGSFIFVVNDPQGMWSVRTYAVDPATGAMTTAGELQLANQSCDSDLCASSPQLVVGPDSKDLYVLVQDLLNDETDITPYAIDPSTGALTAGATTTLLSTSVASMAIDPLGRFLYVANITPGATFIASATISSYSIDPTTGALTAAAPGIAVPSNAGAIATDPNGNYLYVINNEFTAGDNIITLGVAPSTGALSQIGAIVQTSDWPGSAAVDPSGAFLFMGNEGPGPGQKGWNDLVSFAIATGGANAGTVSSTGLGTQFQTNDADADGYFLVIVE